MPQIHRPWPLSGFRVDDLPTRPMNDVPADEIGQRLRRGAARPFLVEAALVVCVLAVFVAYVTPTLDRPLLEKHAWRQTQTAFTARVFHERGIDLLHPALPVFGEPFEVPFEFPLFQAAAPVVMDAGVEDDMAMRVTGLACFLLTALLLFGLVRHVAGPISALGAVVAFVMTPFSLVWARSSMIEYLATAGAVGFTWATTVWRETRVGCQARSRSWPGSSECWSSRRRTALDSPGAPVSTRAGLGATQRVAPSRVDGCPRLRPAEAALLWTRHSDAIKAASPPTAFLTSSRLQEWNFGTVDQRLDPDTWHDIFKRLPSVVGLLGISIVVAAVATWRSPQRRFWVGMWLAAIGPFLVFTNLYFQHDYYLAAVSPAFAALIGSASAALAPLSVRPLTLVSASLVLLVLVYGSLELGRGYSLRIHGADDDPQVLPLARELESLTRTGDLVAYSGLAWSPAVVRRQPLGRMLVFETMRSRRPRHEQG